MDKKKLSAILLATVMLAACATVEDASDNGAEPVQVTLNPYVARLVTVDVIIAGDSARLILDTGGGETIISPEIATRIGCTPTGRSSGFRMSGERIDWQMCSDVAIAIGGSVFEHEELGVWDVHAILPEGMPPVDGVLSLKTFAARPFTLDLANRLLTLESVASYRDRISGMTRLTSRIATGSDGDELTVFVRGSVNEPAWFLVDSGNLDVVQAAPHLGGPEDVWEGVLQLDGMPSVTTAFRTREIIYDGVLSEELMREWLFSFDLASNEVWVAPAQ